MWIYMWHHVSFHVWDLKFFYRDPPKKFPLRWQYKYMHLYILDTTDRVLAQYLYYVGWLWYVYFIKKINLVTH